MKNVKSRVGAVENKLFKTANTVTFEGELAWTLSDKERLVQYAMTGVLGRTFYVSQKTIIDEAIELVKRSDANDLAEAIVLGRNVGYIRSFPILGLAYLSQKNIELFKSVFCEVIKTGGDLGDFIDICHSIRGFGRGVKKAIIKWLEKNVNPYYALKYRKQLADAIRISRIKNNDSIYAFILRDKVDVDKEKLNKSYEEYKEFKAFDSIGELLKNGQYKTVANYIVDYKLDVDSLTAYYNQFDRTIWLAIAKQSPVMRFIKYLNKFQNAGVDVYEIAKEKITVDNLTRAKVFPFRLYMAWREIDNTKISNLLADVLDDYISKYDWSAFNNNSWALCPDISGSMSDRCGSNGNLRYIDIASMMTAFLYKGLDNVDVFPWNSELKKYKMNKKDSVATQMNYLASIGGGGTNMSVALEYLLSNNIKKDYCVFITDTESYSRKSYWGGNGTSWLQAWVKYKARYPKAKAIVLRGDTYNNQPMSQEQCEKYDIYQIFGWNDSVINYIEKIIK